MNRILLYLKKYFNKSLILIILFFCSCAYFNTFYNSEYSYKKAIRIIEESPITENEEIPNQAQTLLGNAIDNGKIVIEKFPDSKYVDDAIFIIAKSAFLRNELSMAERYFKQLNSDFPQSKYFDESFIWLAYTHYKRGMLDSAKYQINNILKNKPNKKSHLYLIYNILGEIALDIDSINICYQNYELAAKYANTSSKKTATYSKLIKISEDYNDFNRTVNYLDKLGKVAPNEIRIDAKLKWITYQRELGNYNLIISEIETLLGLSEFEQEYLKLSLEMGKVYLDIKEFEIAKDIFLNLVDQYTKKDETAEAYYYLGNIAMMQDFNLDMAKEYFKNSKEEKSRSKYGKKSVSLNDKIENYEVLVINYNNSIKLVESEINKEILDDEEVDIDKTNYYDIEEERDKIELSHDIDSDRPDSLLFLIGEMLLYDFNRFELAMEKFIELTESFEQSPFSKQSLYILSHYKPNDGWLNLFDEKYPHSSYNNNQNMEFNLKLSDSLKMKRDNAWELMDRSYTDSKVHFYDIYNQYADTLSLYIAAFIDDYYLHDIESAIENYLEFNSKFPDHHLYNESNKRLDLIRSNLEIEQNIAQQGIDYKSAILLLHNKFDVDSILTIIENISRGEESRFRSASLKLKKTIRQYTDLQDILVNDNTKDSLEVDLLSLDNKEQMRLDSIYYLIANLFEFDFGLIDSSLKYHAQVVNNFEESNFKIRSLINLKNKDSNGAWDSYINIYPDSLIIPDSNNYQISYLQEVFDKDFFDQQNNIIQNCSSYILLFPELSSGNIAQEDSININLSSPTITDSLDQK